MQKSLLAKYFSVCASIIVISITVLGAVMLMFASQYFKQEKYNSLKSNAQRAAAVAQLNFLEHEDQYVDTNSLAAFLPLIANANDSVIFITNLSGRTEYCTEETGSCPHFTYKVNEKVLGKIKDVKQQEYFETGRFDGMYKQPYYTYGLPVRGRDGTTLAYLFTSTSASALNVFLIEIFKMFLISAAAVLVLAFIVIYFVTRQMVKPLREMSNAAKQFGEGNFSTRIRIQGYDEIGQLAMSLNNMAQSLSTIENMRRSFTANVSHELKTPMTTIAGFIDGILDGTIPPEQQNHYLRIVSDEVKRLSRLVRSMLNLSRIEAGELKIQCQTFNIVDTICETMFSFERSIEKKHLDIRGLDHDKLMVDADPDLLHQVIYNLTENAVKFANEGGYIDFNLRQEGNSVFVGVKNSGLGLTKEELPHVFDRFYKTDKSRGLDKNGVGLGLYIVQSIIKLHGGDIIVRSAYGEYTEFVFSVPAAKTAKPTKFKKSSS